MQIPDMCSETDIRRVMILVYVVFRFAPPSKNIMKIYNPFGKCLLNPLKEKCQHTPEKSRINANAMLRPANDRAV
jgi:hypothetical protein